MLEGVMVCAFCCRPCSVPVQQTPKGPKARGKRDGLLLSAVRKENPPPRSLMTAPKHGSLARQSPTNWQRLTANRLWLLGNICRLATNWRFATANCCRLNAKLLLMNRQ